MTNAPEETRPRRADRAVPPRHGRRKHHWGVVLPAVAGVLTMAVLLSGGYAAYAYNRLASSVTKVDAIGSAPPAEDDVDGRAMNILLVGDDHRPDNATPEQLAELSTETDGGATNTDTMIVLHIAADGRSATMISFPRDSYVDIPGVGKGKLNSAFEYGTRDGGGESGGAKKLIATIQGLSGLTIDHYVRVSLLGFYEIVKQLGPVNVCLNQPAKDAYSGVDLPAGVSELDAKQALSFVRQRHGLPNGDLDRQVRQQYFLSQEARKILSAGTLLNPVKTTKIIDAIGSSVETDQGLDLLSLARQTSNLRPANIKSATIPILGTPTIYPNGYALSVVEVDTAGMPAFVQGLVGEPPAYTEAKAADPASVSVTVTNGSGVTGAAAAASAVLTQRGFQVGAPGSSPTTATTMVQYPVGQEAQAKAVASVVPGAVPVQSTTVQGVTLVLGTDGKTPSAPAAETAEPTQPSSPAEPSEEAAAPEPTEPSPSSTAVHEYGQEGVCIN
ncbi:LCP family protein [Curtobacterium sp. MCBD17_032]|uniref:LCP family protein n=1 Tax=Curtobacterium sp. MCBD17_032 TaxID=2175659 RepID=UPI0021AC1FE4|nr:LCP family protein [Curtobacterium sp. MCBD17_032]